MKNPMKSSVDSFDVTVDNSIVTISKPSIHAGCYGVSMIDTKTPMCARVRVCAQESYRNIETS